MYGGYSTSGRGNAAYHAALCSRGNHCQNRTFQPDQPDGWHLDAFASPPAYAVAEFLVHTRTILTFHVAFTPALYLFGTCLLPSLTHHYSSPSWLTLCASNLLVFALALCLSLYRCFFACAISSPSTYLKTAHTDRKEKTRTTDFRQGQPPQNIFLCG